MREHVAIPALLATSAVHQHLVAKGLRTRTGLVVETGSARETHHFAVLAGYGAEAVHPYLALETLAQIAGGDAEKRREGIKHFIKGVGKGLLKVMSKMGISTYMSYTGAQIFEAIGLQKGLVDKYFTGTSTKVEGIGVFEVMEEAIRLHRRPSATTRCWPHARRRRRVRLPRARRRAHVDAGRHRQAAALDALRQVRHLQGIRQALINDQSKRHMTLRGLFEIKPAGPPCRSTKSSRPRRSSSASPPAPCRWVRSPPRRTARWPWP
jgi:glutamate synthase (NADPH/NADH) large chain